MYINQILTLGLIALLVLNLGLHSFLVGLGLLRLDRQAREESANASLVVTVLRVLASADLFGQARATLEDSEISQSTQPSPIEVCFSAIAGPKVQGHPDSLFGNKVGVTRP